MQDIHKEKLEHLNEDEFMLQAIKAVFNARINKSLPKVEESENNVIGEKYRAFCTARDILQAAFLDIESFKKGLLTRDKINKGK